MTVERPLRLKGIDPEPRLHAERDQSGQGRAANITTAGLQSYGKSISGAPSRIHYTACSRRASTENAAWLEYEPDTDLRDTEQVPLLEEGGIEAFIRREVLRRTLLTPGTTPESVKIGYEISFTRYFYKPQPLRTLEEIRGDISGTGERNRGACSVRSFESAISTWRGLRSSL